MKYKFNRDRLNKMAGASLVLILSWPLAVYGKLIIIVLINMLILLPGIRYIDKEYLKYEVADLSKVRNY